MKHVFVGSIPIFIDGEPYVGFGMYIDITEQVKYDKKLSDSLKEKQVLLQEIHHRVKNNLAVISGLLQLQIFEAENEGLKRALQESQSRIHTMGLIHEKLYQSRNLSRISCKSYVEELIETIHSTFVSFSPEVEVETRIENVELNINQAVPFALLLNEVLSNAFKHAFRDRDKGSIRVELREERSMIHVCISDNGAGLPEGFSIEGEESLGMTLIHRFLKQLKAEWELRGRHGTTLDFRFRKDRIKGSSATLV